MKQTLQNLVAEGKTKQVIDKLKILTANNSELHQEVIQISARYNQHKLNSNMGLESSSKSNIELNKINKALLWVIERLDEPSDETAQKFTTIKPTKNKWIKIGAVLVAIIGVIASIAQISGYSIKDFFSKEEKNIAIERPTIDKPKEKESVIIPKGDNTKLSVKNQTNIKVEKGGKVGAVITGDSNKIDLKQDF